MSIQKPTCAVISTWKIKCGIAGYTHALVPALEDYFDVTVFPLNQSILKSNEPSLIKLGNSEIHRVCKEIQNFDYVNIQFEPGIFGSRPSVIFKRLFMLLDSSSTTSITFHTVKEGTGLSRRAWLLSALKGIKSLREFRRRNVLNSEYIRMYKKLSKPRYKNVFLIFHTLAAQDYVNLRYPKLRTIDHPLTFIDLSTKKKAQANVASHRQWLISKYRLSENDIIVSTFGFISEYKGFETAIRALERLPNNFKLLIFGATHPNAISPTIKGNEYLNELIELIEELDKKNQNKENDEGFISRVLFAGDLNDKEFERAINGSNINVFCYKEVGQTSSGPISISLDLGKTTIATNNHCFKELSRYAPNCITHFDISNHLQLTSMIESNTNDLHVYGEEYDKYRFTYSIENRSKLIYQTFSDLTNILNT